MNTPVVADLVVVRPDADADLEAMVFVRAAVEPNLPPPRLENLRHNLEANPDLAYLVVRVGGRPVACGFVESDPGDAAGAHAIVVREMRRRGIGSALLAELSRLAAARGKRELQGEIRQDDAESRGFFERRGYRAVGGEEAVALDLSALEAPAVEAPAGIEIVSRADRPDVVAGMYEVARDAVRDIPGEDGEARGLEAWRAAEIERPTRRPELAFVALAGDEVVGSAVADDFGELAFHSLTAVKRGWRRRGVATALKRAQIAAAKELGCKRLVTESETRNLPMRRLNEKLGYRPEPSLSTVVLRGPLL